MKLSNSPLPLEDFYLDLVEFALFKEMMMEVFEPEDASIIFEKLKAGSYHGKQYLDFLEVINEIILCDSKEISHLTGVGGYGEFSILIKQYGPLFWIDTPDYSIQYFKSLDDAAAFAESNWLL